MRRIEANRNRYLCSLSDELRSQADRVRNLIGGTHWLSDGRHKEELLLGLLKRHLPTGLSAARGFVIDPADDSNCSTEQDILIIEESLEAPIFRSGDLIIAFPSIVRAAISVKTTMRSQTIAEATQGLATALSLSKRTDPHGGLWCGAFFYVEDDTLLRNRALGYKYIRDALKEHPVVGPVLPSTAAHALAQGPELYATSEHLTFRVDYNNSPSPQPRIVANECNGLAAAVFLANLLHHVSVARGSRSQFTRITDVEDLPVIPDTIPV